MVIAANRPRGGFGASLAVVVAGFVAGVVGSRAPASRFAGGGASVCLASAAKASSMRFTRNFLFGLFVLSPVAALKRSHSSGSGSVSRFSFFVLVVVLFAFAFVLMTVLLVGRWVHVGLHARARSSRVGARTPRGARARSGQARSSRSKHARSTARGSLVTK